MKRGTLITCAVLLSLIPIAGLVLYQYRLETNAFAPASHSRFPSQTSTPSEARVPVILNTDIGDDMDDMWALALLLGSPQIDLRPIVTAWEDAESREVLEERVVNGVSGPCVGPTVPAQEANAMGPQSGA